MLTQKLRLAATSLFLFVGLTTALFGALPAQTVFAQDSEPTTSDTEENTLNTSPEEGEDGCEKGWNALDWIGCKVLGIIDETLDWLNKTINSLLFIDPVPEGIEGTWAVFRNLAYIILVPMMLLMVIGTAINMGPFDPYTVKKALPRMFIAVIFIALSLPLCSFFINVSNVIGNGAGNIITSLSGTELNEIDGSGTTTSGVITAGALLGLTGVISWPIVGSLGLVMVVGLLIGFFILILRQVLVVMLIILAPLAILVWIFPGNDKLWAVWRTTFTAMLFMYPLIAVLIASGKFFAQTAQASEVGGGPPVSTIVAMIGYVAPYFLIPATFKYGLGVFGNLAGMVNDRGRGFFDNQRKRRAASREHSMEHATWGSRRRTAARANAYQTLMGRGSDQNNNWVKQKAYRGLARGVGGYNIAAQTSAMQARVGKEINDQIATGDDTEIRALTARKLQRIGSDGQQETYYQSLAGREVDEASVMRARSRWGNDRFAQQAALSYEMRKAISNDNVEDIADNYTKLAKETWGMSDNETTNAWIGSAFENQNKHLAFKNMRAETTGTGPDKKIVAGGKMSMANNPGGFKNFAREIYENRGSYNMAQMSGHTIEQLKEAYDSGDEETKSMVQAAAETFMSRYGGGSGIQGMDEEKPIQSGAVGAAADRPSYQTNTPGAAHTAEAVRDLATHVGIYRPLDPSTDIHSAGGDGTQPRQN